MTSNSNEDIFSLSPGLLNIKKITGISQMLFALIVLCVYFFWWAETLLLVGSIGVFSVGFFIYGVQFQNAIIRSRKEVLTARGFLFVVFENRYTRNDCQELNIVESVKDRKHNFSDIDGKGSGRYGRSYKLKIKLKNGKAFEFSSSEDLDEMESLGKEISTILECPLTSDFKLYQKQFL
jgi:hypothetical protein